MSTPFSQIKQSGIYWVYSKKGPDDNRKLAPYQLEGGVLTVPVMGAVARELVVRGLCAMEATDIVLPVFQRAPSGEWCSVPALVAGEDSSPPSPDVEPPAQKAPMGPAAVLPQPPAKPEKPEVVKPKLRKAKR